MTLLRDRGFRRVTPPSSPVDGLATVAIGLLLATAVAIVVIFLFAAGAVTAWLRATAPHDAVPMYHQLPERAQ